jgi:hypothetical protein
MYSRPLIKGENGARKAGTAEGQKPRRGGKNCNGRVERPTTTKRAAMTTDEKKQRAIRAASKCTISAPSNLSFLASSQGRALFSPTLKDRARRIAASRGPKWAQEQVQKKGGDALANRAVERFGFNCFPLLSLSPRLPLFPFSSRRALSAQETHRDVSMFLEPSANMDAMDCLFSSLAGAASASFSAAG